jgi:uncharacterized protein YodC (DUF2158 family)
MTRRTKKIDPSIHPDGKPLEIGEVVMLMSGGPKMTVHEAVDPEDDTPSVECAWFTEGDWGNGPRASVFHPKTLKRVDL